MGGCAALCQIKPNAADSDLDNSLSQVLQCHLQDAETLAKCSARKAAVESALKECAAR